MKNTVIIVLLLMIACKENKDLDIKAKKEDKITASTVDTLNLKIYDFKGLAPLLNKNDDTIYVVNFWATWCAPCVKELPYFEAIHRDYQSKNVKVILVSLDFPNQYVTKLKPFIKKHQLKSKIVVLNDVDSNNWIPKINKDWSGAIPATIIYNKDKKRFYEKSFNLDELKTEVDKFLN